MISNSPNIFLSYARFDETVAQSIYSKIEEWGFTVWIDKYEIYPGDDWPGKTMKAIDRAKIVLLLISPDWLSHDGFVKDEFYRAISNSEQKGTRIIPLLLNLDNPPDKLAKYHCIKWTDKEEREKLRELLSNFRQKKVVKAILISLSISLVLLSVILFNSQTQNSSNTTSEMSQDMLYSAIAPQQKSRFDAYVIDAVTKQPLAGATASVMRNKAELITRSTPSDSTGHVVASVDTLPEIWLQVVISCAGYEKYTETYLMKADFYDRKVSLNRITKKKIP